MFKMWIEMQTENNIISGIAFLYTGICAVFDVRHREIPFVWIFAGIAAAAGIDLWQIRDGAISLTSVGVSLMPGIFFLLISFWTGEKVGYGDGMLILATGLFLGAYRCFLALCIGLVCSSCTAVFLLLFHKADRHSRMPFVPFLLLGMGVIFFV